MARSKKSILSVDFEYIGRATGVTFTDGTEIEMTGVRFAPGETVFVVGGVIKYYWHKAAGVGHGWWFLLRQTTGTGVPDLEDEDILRDLWENNDLLASGFFQADVVQRDHGAIWIIPVRKTTLREDEVLKLVVAPEVTGSDYIHGGRAKYMFKKV